MDSVQQMTSTLYSSNTRSTIFSAINFQRIGSALYLIWILMKNYGFIFSVTILDRITNRYCKISRNPLIWGKICKWTWLTMIKGPVQRKLNWPHNDVLPYILVDFQSVVAPAAAIVTADEEIANVYVVAVFVWQNYLSFVMLSM